MNYGIFINYRLTISICIWFRCFSLVEVYESLGSLDVVWHVWCVLYNKSLCLISCSDSLYFIVYRNIVKKYVSGNFEMFQKMSQKCQQFSYEICLGVFCGFLS